MQIENLSDNDELATAFATWAAARDRLAQLRAQAPRGPDGGQLATSPKSAAFFEAVRAQEAACAQCWRELARVDEELAATRDAAFGPDTFDIDRQHSERGAGDSLASSDSDDPPVDILIVDDETSNLAALEAVLGDPAYRVVRAASGEQALLAVMRGEFACMLLDVQMPGMTGLELARMINERRRSGRPPIIFLTAHDKEDEHALAGYSTGAVDYVHKPFHPVVLRQKVEVFAHLHRMNRRLRQRSAERERLACIEIEAASAALARERADFLARAAGVLSAAHEPEDVGHAMLDLCVPMFGEAAVLCLVDDDGAVRFQQAHSQRAGTAPHALSAELRVATQRAIGDREFRLSRDGARASAVCALTMPDRPLGALGIAGAAERLDGAYAELLQEFASRAAIVLENARLKTAIRHVERRKHSFLAMLAHELRNPLAPISNAAHIIRTDTTGPSTTHWAGEVIGRQADQLSRIVDDLLDVGRLAQGKVRLKREPLTLARVVELGVESSRPQTHHRQQTIAVDMPAETIAFEGDPVRLAQAVSNLINNASAFSDAGTTICVTAAVMTGEVRISVKDSGAGIAPELLPRVFDLFEQGEQSLERPRGGLGVGLTLVKHIVEGHGGHVAARSDGLGQGTQVVMHIPLSSARSEPAGSEPEVPVTRPEPTASGRRPVRVLVVDDEPAAAETLMALLELAGCDVRVANDGPAALEAAQAFHPEVVVLDIGLPGMSGFEVAHRLRAQPDSRTALLIALTGYGDAETVSRAVRAGFDSHMTKPADVGRLLAMVADVGANTRENGD